MKTTERCQGLENSQPGRKFDWLHAHGLLLAASCGGDAGALLLGRIVLVDESVRLAVPAERDVPALQHCAFEPLERDRPMIDADGANSSRPSSGRQSASPASWRSRSR